MNLVIAQGGGATAVVNSSLYGVLKRARETEQRIRVIGARRGMSGVLENDLLDVSALPADEMENLRSLPGAALGSSRRKHDEADFEAAVGMLQKLDVDAFLMVGGNGSMAAALRLEQAARSAGSDLRVIGIPKTVDNDLQGTDRSPGYGSAARYTAQSVCDLGADVRSLPVPVSMFESMGRNAGWLAGASALARVEPDDAPHLVYLPEYPFDPDGFIDQVDAVYRRLGWVVAVVSEGIRTEDGAPVFQTGDPENTGQHGKAPPGGAASSLSELVTRRLGLRSRSEKPGLCGRSSILLASDADRADAVAVGRAAVEAVLRGESGCMTALKPRESASAAPATRTVPLREPAGAEKTVPARWIADNGHDVTREFIDYVRPQVDPGVQIHLRCAALPLAGDVAPGPRGR